MLLVVEVGLRIECSVCFISGGIARIRLCVTKMMTLCEAMVNLH